MMVAHGNLAVAFHWQFAQALLLAIPAWHHVELVYGYHLLVAVAGKDVVHAQCLVYEIVIKVLCCHLAWCHQQRQGG